MDQPFMPSEPHECKERAEDPQRPTDERLVWAQLAVAAELAAVRRLLSKGRR